MTYTRIIRVVVDNICCWLFFVKNCVLFILSSIFFVWEIQGEFARQNSYRIFFTGFFLIFFQQIQILN